MSETEIMAGSLPKMVKEACEIARESSGGGTCSVKYSVCDGNQRFALLISFEGDYIDDAEDVA
ncbi:hypothetical protein [Gemmobacter caeni]|uniref:hypothetical protein n=1 Tax=Gemmobacter caeni TaxID=589035 RepID=UPI0011AB0AAA|nr:hypothetical protein [Gemmobacter caeni]